MFTTAEVCVMLQANVLVTTLRVELPVVWRHVQATQQVSSCDC